jgi:hypothetical protein
MKRIYDVLIKRLINENGNGFCGNIGFNLHIIQQQNTLNENIQGIS